MNKPEPIKLAPTTHERQATCAVHGAHVERGGCIYPGRGIMWFGCPACSAAAKARDEAKAARAKEVDRQTKIEAKLNAGGIPAALRDRSFDTYAVESPEMAQALRVVRSFADDFWSKHNRRGTFLVLCGTRGTGKGHLGVAAAMQVLGRGTAMYTRVADMIRHVRSTWRRDSELSEDEVLRLYGRELDLLVVDEIGVQRGSDDEQNTLFDILDQRYSELRPTIIISNLNGADLGKFLGPRLMDRLVERAVIVPFTWESFRSRVR